MSSMRRITPVIMILAVLMMCFSQYSFLIYNYPDSSMEDDDGSSPDDGGTTDERSRAGDPVVIFSEGFESGNFNAGPWNAGNGWTVSNTDPRTGTHHAEASALVTDSTLALGRNIDLSNYKNVRISFFQYNDETEDTDLYYFEASGTGGNSWAEISKKNGQELRTADYEEFNLDLSAYTGNARFRMRFRFTSSHNAEWSHIDDIILTGVPIIEIENETISAAPTVMNRCNGTANITGSFWDMPGYKAYEYEITIAIRDSGSNEIIILNNKTSGNNSLIVTKVPPGHFFFSFNWTPGNNIPFDRYDFRVEVQSPNSTATVPYSNNDAHITLLSISPFFQDEIIFFENEPVNILDFRDIPIKVVFYDEDAQESDDYSITLRLEREGSNITVFDNISNSTGLQVSQLNSSRYEATYLWHPENAIEMAEGEYRINITLWETDEYLIDMEMFNISRNVSLVKKYLPMVLSLSCEPERLNITGPETTTIRAEFSDLDTQMEADFEVYLKIRDGNNNTIVLLDGESSGEAGVSIEKTGSIRWRLTYEYEPINEISPGYYDLYFGVFDGDSNLNFDGFDNNSDKLFLYNNTSPVIDEVELSDSIINIYGTNACRLTATFDDADGEAMGNFSANLSLKDPEGNIHTLIGGEGSDGRNATIPYLNPLDATTYIFTYDIDPDASFVEGSYEIFFSVSDGWSGRDCVVYGEGDLGFLLFYDAVPTPPGKIWPNSTSDTTPLISWWGALDEETPYEELVYDIQIGTAPGDDTILPWHDNGLSTSYQMGRELGVGVYYIQLRSSDGRFDSDILSSTMTITDNGNQPPGIPGPITPIYTVKQDPKISWGSSHDPDVNDLVEYYITIGTKWHGDDITRRMPTSVNTFYQFPFPLNYDTYYVQITATDGHETSPIREQAMVIFDPLVNIVPMPPTSLSPRETPDSTPMIRWDGAVDLNDDELFFWVRIGTSSGADDVMPWRSSGVNDYFPVEEPLGPGLYYVQVKCYDGSSFSEVYESTIRIILAETIVGPALMGPAFSMERTPLLNWSGAHYANTPAVEENFSYYIRLGSDLTNGDFLDWTFIANMTSYKVTNKLPINVPIYVQIKAFDGVQTSAVVTSTLLIGEFRLTVGFNETSYLFIVNHDKNQTIKAFIKNYGSNNVTVLLSVEGTFSKYVVVPRTPITLGGGELITFPIRIRVPSNVLVSKADSFIDLIATSVDDSNSERSERLHFNTREVEKEKWTSAGGGFYLLLAFGVLGLTFILILLLLPQRVKRAKAERFDIDNDMPANVKNVTIDEYIPPDLYSTFRFTERRGLKAMDGVMVETFKKYGVFETAAKVKIKRIRTVNALGDGTIKKRRLKALPPPAPGVANESTRLSGHPEETGIMPPPPGEEVELLTEGAVTSIVPEIAVELETPLDILPGRDAQDLSEFEYIPPERSDSGSMPMEGVIIDVEVDPVEFGPEIIEEPTEAEEETPEFFEVGDLPVEESDAPPEDEERGYGESDGIETPPEFEVDESAHFEELPEEPAEFEPPLVDAEAEEPEYAGPDEREEDTEAEEPETPESSHEPAVKDDDGTADEGHDEPAAEDDDEPAAEDDDEPAAEDDDEPAAEDDGEPAAEDDDGPTAEDNGESAAEVDDEPADDDVHEETVPPPVAEAGPEDEDDGDAADDDGGEGEDGTALDDIMNILGIEED